MSKFINPADAAERAVASFGSDVLRLDQPLTSWVDGNACHFWDAAAGQQVMCHGQCGEDHGLHLA